MLVDINSLDPSIKNHGRLYSQIDRGVNDYHSV